MNYLVVSWLTVCGMAGGQGAAYFIGAAAIDSNTSIPLGWVLGSATTILLVGTWISKKTTRVEALIERLEERDNEQARQIANIITSQQERSDREARRDERIYRLEQRWQQ